jgi:hypothetical protein
VDGVKHVVSDGETLVFLAEWYYGDSGAWRHIYYANLPIYGDDTEMIPGGTAVFIPNLETEEVKVTVRGYGRRVTGEYGRITQQRRDIIKGAVAPVYRTFGEVSGEPSWRFGISDNGHNFLELKLKNKGIVTLGLLGIERTAELLGVDKSEISNVYGRSELPDGSTDSPIIPYSPFSEPKSDQFSPDVIMEAVIKYYGHSYMYYDVLERNGLTDTEVVIGELTIVMPSRGDRSKMMYAARWRKRLKKYGSPQSRI